MARPSLLVLLAAALLLIAGQPARAVLTPLADGRYLHAEDLSGALGDCGHVTPAQPYQDWSAGHGCLHGDVTQDSHVHADELAGQAGIETYGGGFDIDVGSVYEIDFSVDETTPFEILVDVGFFADAEEAPDVHPDSGGGASLLRDGGTVFEFEVELVSNGFSIGIDGPDSASFRGVLEPGSVYRFTSWLRSHSQTGTFATLDHSLVPVPEPSSGALLGLGLLGLVSRRRVRRSA